MKTALKWIGWSLLALIGAGIFFSVDKTAQTVIVLLAAGSWIVTEYGKDQERRRKALDYRLGQIEERLDALLQSSVHSRYVGEGLEEMVDEHRARKRALDCDPHRP